MAASNYIVVTPKHQTIRVTISDANMLAVPIPAPEGEDDFARAINRTFAALSDLEAAIVASGGSWTLVP